MGQENRLVSVRAEAGTVCAESYLTVLYLWMALIHLEVHTHEHAHLLGSLYERP